MSYIGRTPSNSENIVDKFVSDGTTNVLTLTEATTTTSTTVTFDGVKQDPNVDYYITEKLLHLSSVPISGVKIEADYGRSAKIIDAITDTSLRVFLSDEVSSLNGPGAIGIGPSVAYQVGTVGYEETQEVHVSQFSGCDPTGVSDSTAALLAAATYAATLPNGATLVLPRGVLTVSSVPSLSPKVNWRGHGRLNSLIAYTGTGDGLHFNGTVNTYTALRITLRDFGIYTTNTVTNTGGGLVLESCSLINVENLFVQGFKYGHILDQVIHFNCSFSEFTQQTRACIWVVNGADRRVSASKIWTNNIWYGKEIQLNLSTTGSTYLLQDDGGANHDYTGINFNGGTACSRLASVLGLVYKNNAHEGALNSPVVFDDTTRELGTYVGPCEGYDISNNTFSNGSVPYQIVINAIGNGSIKDNLFAQMSAASVFFGSNKIRGIEFARNSKLITGTFKTSKPFFDSSLTQEISSSVNTQNQPCNTYVSSAASAGSVTVTPATMEKIRAGMTILAQNDDGTNSEKILITSTTSTTFTTTLSLSKSANWTLYGQTSTSLSNTWTPIIAGSTTAGVNTYTGQQGDWSVRPDGSIHVRGTLTLSTKDAAMAGGVLISGFPISSSSGTNKFATFDFGYYSGLTFPANFTQLSGLVTPGTNLIALRRMGSGQAGTPVQVSEIAAGSLLVFEGVIYPA